MPRLAPVTTTVLPSSFATRASPRLRRLRRLRTGRRLPGAAAAAAPDDGEDFDLDDEPGRRERGDLHQRGRGRIAREEGLACAQVLVAAPDVGDEAGHLHDV